MIPEQALAQWLPQQRWFAGKGARITGLAITQDTELAAGGNGTPGLRHLIVTVTQGTTRDSYQVLAGLRSDIPGSLEHAVIGPLPDGRVAYDALHDQELTRLLLQGIADERSSGPLRFSRVSGGGPGSDPGSDPDRGPDSGLAEGLADNAGSGSLVLTGEQSNTSLVFGEAAILKVFRRVAPGPNPDLEVAAALGRLRSPHVAEPYGWIEARADGEVTILAILSRYLQAASDGWSLAATSVRDLYDRTGSAAAEAGGDFAGEARRLGAATAAVHKDLLRAFGGEELAPQATAQLAGQMNARLADVLAAVPALRDQADLLGATFSRLAELREPMPVQRIHGDYHLGQVMRTQAGWVLLDFEGEPAVPLPDRRALSSPLRDVAGMLRSFDYAARQQLLGHGDRVVLELSARDWVRRNTDAFCAGYAQAGGIDPREHATLLKALECDKAVYEVMYEARNRPSWLPIPLDSIAAMAGDLAADPPADQPPAGQGSPS